MKIGKLASVVAVALSLMCTNFFPSHAEPNADAAAIKRITDWVSAQGNAARVTPVVARLLGIGLPSNEHLSSVQKAYMNESDGDSVGRAFGIVAFEGRQELVLMWKTTKEVLIWRLDRDGKIIVTLYVGGGAEIRAVPNQSHRQKFEETIRYFSEKVPSAM